MRYIDLPKLLKKRSSWGHSQELWKNDKLVKDFKKYGFDKCWYTEVELYGQDPHIDHWRPKAEIKPYKKYNYNKPLRNQGYDWLKNDPSNYRVSCIYSNRRTGKGGKGCYFPLSTNSQYLTYNGNQKETPLLLDPCNKNDVKLISFIGAKVIAVTKNALERRKVSISATIYNIKDPTIAHARQKVWDDVSRIIMGYQNKEILFDMCIELLKNAIDRRAKFSACAIACVRSSAPPEIIQTLGALLNL